MTDFGNLDEVLAELRARAVKTSQGSFIRVEDLEELMQGFAQQKVEQQAPSDIKSFAQAKTAAKSDPNIQAAFSKPREEAVAQQAFRGQATPIANEGVKS